MIVLLPRQGLNFRDIPRRKLHNFYQAVTISSITSSTVRLVNLRALELLENFILYCKYFERLKGIGRVFLDAFVVRN